MTAPRAKHLKSSKQKSPLPKGRRPDMTVQALSEAAGDRTRERVQGRDILAIQDTSEIVLGGPKMGAELVLGRLAVAAFWVGFLCILFWPLMRAKRGACWPC